jgi:tetratricopeptide (TPR) repeat protein
MFANPMRAAVAVIMRVVMIATASTAGLLAQPEPSAVETYRAAVAAYLTSGDAARSARRLADLGPAELEPGVKAVLGRSDPKELEAAADLHLEIGIAVAGLSVSGAAAYFDQGSRLVSAILPLPAIRRGLSAPRLEELTLISTTWHRVAASTLLSINDVARARPMIVRARRIVPQSAPLLTVLGTAHEIDAGVNKPEDWDSVAKRTHTAQTRARLLLAAEESYKAALENDAAYPLAWIRLGRVQFLQNDVRTARASLERGAALAREPRHQFLAAMFMGALQEAQKDLDGARQSYERALASAPQSQNAVAALAFVELLSGRTGRAEEVARAYTSAKLDDAWWLHKTGVFDVEGLQWLRQHLRQ